MKDFAIKRRPAELSVVLQYGARCFCLPNANMKARPMAERFIENVDRITRACERPGPFLYTVQAGRLQHVRLR